MMKLLLAVIATCALVVSPTCIKIKHQLRSNAPTIHVLISNGNTQMTSQVGRNGSHRFITDNLSSMTLAPAGSQNLTLSYDDIFPITDAGVCIEVHPVSAGGCADGVCCKISISLYTITDAIIMTARVNNRKADGNPQFWKCKQEIQVSGVANTEASPEELVTDILHGEQYIDDAECIAAGCGTVWHHASCVALHEGIDGHNCKCVDDYVYITNPNYNYYGYIDSSCVANCTDNANVCAKYNAECVETNSNNEKGCVCKQENNFITTDGGVTCYPDCSQNPDICPDHSQCIVIGNDLVNGGGNDIKGCVCIDTYATGEWTDENGPTCIPECDQAYSSLCSSAGICDTGYRGDGEICHDIDECAESTELCNGNHEVCKNEPAGGYTCSCADGYQYDGSTGNCVDINECAEETMNECNGNNEACYNEPEGSYTCDCAPGYQYPQDESTGNCVDINECITTVPADEHKCLIAEHCTNTPAGSYTCACNSGYYGDGFKLSATNPNTGVAGTGCKAKLGLNGVCTADEECLTNNCLCNKGVCQCRP